MKEVVTQKELMVMPNAPRFFREGDKMQFTAKVSNLSPKDLDGTAKLELFDALTMEKVDVQCAMVGRTFPTCHSTQWLSHN